MNITVLDETYEVSEPVGRKYHALMAKGWDELDAARTAVDDPWTIEPTMSKAIPTQPSVKVDVGSPVFNLHMPATTVNVPETQVTYTAPDVHVTTPDVTILPTVVNVAAPDVTVHPPEVNVAAPNVTVKPPDVQVKADVTVSPEMRITSMPDRITRREVKRDKAGQITESTDVEVDG